MREFRPTGHSIWPLILLAISLSAHLADKAWSLFALSTPSSLPGNGSLCHPLRLPHRPRWKVLFVPTDNGERHRERHPSLHHHHHHHHHCHRHRHHHHPHLLNLDIALYRLLLLYILILTTKYVTTPTRYNGLQYDSRRMNPILMTGCKTHGQLYVEVGAIKEADMAREEMLLYRRWWSRRHLPAAHLHIGYTWNWWFLTQSLKLGQLKTGKKNTISVISPRCIWEVELSFVTDYIVHVIFAKQNVQRHVFH